MNVIMNLYFAFYYHIEFTQISKKKFAGEYLLFQHSVIMRSDELVISSIVISLYYGFFHFFLILILILKKPTSHTLSIAIISNH
ncbi:hypothetical protein RchiOBHm_Chr2g0118551 [Rosa chinensis]|uniref:Uncharacterized protein n=1 Tax=Rosa chinensis TaxID=74649 RepID=A0A2P6RRS1_ROSCH|nr:hypothetical protein RchiOBHm_Chr2g0118551 [Rosa chinensis]